MKTSSLEGYCLDSYVIPFRQWLGILEAEAEAGLDNGMRFTARRLYLEGYAPQHAFKLLTGSEK